MPDKFNELCGLSAYVLSETEKNERIVEFEKK